MKQTAKERLLFILRASMIAALYLAVTLLAAPISYGPLQVRIAEAFTILPYFTTAAVPGLFIGCLIANLFGGYGLIDIFVGSIATLIAALITRKIKNRFLVPLPSVLINAVAVGVTLYFLTEKSIPVWLCMLQVGAGQAIACYGLGLPLLFAIEKIKTKTID